jgi:hypothetical protein
MKQVRVLRLIAGIAIAATTLIVPIAGLRWWWHTLALQAEKTTPRLQYYFVAAREMEQGHQVTSEDLEFRLSRRPQGEDLVQIPADITGSFVVVDHIHREGVLERSQFLPSPFLQVPLGGAVVPVEVSRNHISGLRSGMRLAFVNDKEMTPTEKDLARKKPEPTFLLLSITIPAKDKDAASLLVAVEKCRMPLVKKIANGVWRPVIVQGVK